MNILNQKTSLYLLALLAGAILPLAFAPFGYYLTAEIGLVLLLFTWQNATPKQAFGYGWLFGIAFFSCGLYWIYISIHHYGNAPAALTILILALLVAFLALYPAVQGYLLNRFYPQNNLYKFLLAFPTSFVILEWIRGWLFSGFPWLFLGYGHIDAPLRGWGAILGVYGISFSIAQTAATIFCIYYYRKNKKTMLFLALFTTMLWSIGSYLATINWSKQTGELIKVSLIQANIAQEEKWQDGNLESILNSYTTLSANNFTSKIIVWPEAAIPTLPQNVEPFIKTVAANAKKHGATILSGIPFYEAGDQPKNSSYYNGMLAFGKNNGKYYKRHLVPFGEYFPFKFALNWLRNFIIIPMSDFSAGSKNQSGIAVDNILLAPFICYEIAYPELALDYMPKAGLLVTVSDDSWFGDSIAAAQHLEIARMRSLEVGRYQLLCTNTGITAIINDKGKIINEAPIFKQAIINASVANLNGSTPWVKAGQYIWVPLFLLGMWWARKKKD